MTKQERTAVVKELSRQFGFDVVGVAPPDRLDREGENLMRWIEMGYAATMSYMEQNAVKRYDPKKILPEAQSIIVLGLNYFPGNHGTPSSNKAGRVAKYAKGRDYHRVFERKLRLFVKTLADHIGHSFKAKVYVDTGPILERPFAQRAGIGFIGKNTLAIARRYGSWVLLAELITDLELEFDKPDLRDCGSCTKCLKACPTDAFVGPYQLDARRCISFLTIENKGAIDRSLRSKMGDWVFGCDICQDVCPLNHQAEPHGTEEFQQPDDLERHEGLWLNLEDILTMRTGDVFEKRFEGSPIRRAKREGLLRNAAVAAGNSHNEEFIPVLTNVLKEDTSEMVRLHAAWALGEIGTKAAQDALRQAYECENSDPVLEEIGYALNQMNQEQAYEH